MIPIRPVMQANANRVAILVYFNSTISGIHENVRDTVRAVHSAGGSVLVVCPAGQFAGELKGEGHKVITWPTDDNRLDLVQQICAHGPFLAVHTHPGPSRHVALMVAEALGCPLIMTIHSAWVDDLPDYVNQVAKVVAVSPSVRYKLVWKHRIPASKVAFIPNAVCTGLFKNPGEPNLSGRLRVAVVSRFDNDKSAVVEFLSALWGEHARTANDQLEWFVAGQGTREAELRAAAQSLNNTLGRSAVHWVGWLPREGLADFYRGMDAAVASGRAAMEAMACRLPTIALASRGCFGLVDQRSFYAARSCNFGGFGLRARVSPGAILDELCRLHLDLPRRQHIGRFSRRAIEEYFEGQVIADKAVSLYRSVSAIEMRTRALNPPEPRKGPDLAVVVISVGAPRELSRAVRSILAQNVKTEIVVVNSKGGNPEKVLAKFAGRIRIISVPELLWPGAARNVGIRATDAPFIAFLASDCEAQKKWAQARLRRHKKRRPAVASSLVNSHPKNLFAWASHLSLFARRLPDAPRAYVLRYGASYSRELFELYGFFREDLRSGEDTEFNARLKGRDRVVWAPEIRTVHRNPLTFKHLIRDQHRRGYIAAVAWDSIAGRSRAVTFGRSFSRFATIARLTRVSLHGRDRILGILSLPLVALCTMAYTLGSIRAIRELRSNKNSNRWPISFDEAKEVVGGSRD